MRNGEKCANTSNSGMWIRSVITLHKTFNFQLSLKCLKGDLLNIDQILAYLINILNSAANFTIHTLMVYFCRCLEFWSLI